MFWKHRLEHDAATNHAMSKIGTPLTSLIQQDIRLRCTRQEQTNSKSCAKTRKKMPTETLSHPQDAPAAGRSPPTPSHYIPPLIDRPAQRTVGQPCQVAYVFSDEPTPPLKWSSSERCVWKWSSDQQPHSCSTTTWASILFCVRKKETTRFHSYDPTSVQVKQIIVFFSPLA